MNLKHVSTIEPPLIVITDKGTMTAQIVVKVFSDGSLHL